ncbi:acyl carrier protein [Telmatospirillum siberiense]|uniref:Acyl carrier protein n=1 Tax=Telmatospirillum siberiense TaxID=382514 RepID=A0A2N3PW16_9PROT|nr:acyl carrier protein [Telmatospirillum siberiense]PKU24590.1 acyl carrier protein [Telmatospirillum siberiense]
MASRDELYQKLTEYLVELFEIEPGKITPDAKLFEELDLDSIDAVDLVVKLQEYTGRRVKPEEFKAVRTVGDVVDCLERLLKTHDLPA